MTIRYQHNNMILFEFIKLFLIINSYMIPKPQFQLKFMSTC